MVGQPAARRTAGSPAPDIEAGSRAAGDQPESVDVPFPVAGGPGLPVATMTAIVLVVLGLTGMAETGRLVTGALTAEGRSGSLSEVTGPFAWSHRDVWAIWQEAERLQASLPVWIGLFNAFDVLFFAGYGWLTFRLVRRVPVAAPAVLLLLAVEVVETVLWLVVVDRWAREAVPGGLVTTLAVVTTVKWLVVVFLLVAIARNETVRRRIGRGSYRAFTALRVQRLSLVLVVVFAVLALVPSPGVFDQFPDVLRGWFGGDEASVSAHAIWAVVACLVVAAGLFVLGRQRSERAWSSRVGRCGPTPPTRSPQWAWWLAGPAAVGIAYVVLWRSGHEDLVHGDTVRWVLGVPVSVLVLSGVIQWWCGDQLWRETPRRRTADGLERARDVWVAGDVLAAALLLVGALAVARALVAPVLLGHTEDRWAPWVLRFVVLVGFAVVALVIPGVLDVFVRWVDGLRVPGGFGGRLLRLVHPRLSNVGGPLGNAGAGLVWAAGIGTLVALMLFPVQIGGRLGVAATALLALGAWAVVLGFLIVHMQHHRPMAVFRLFHLRADPVLTLLLLVALVASLEGGDERLHALRVPAAPVEGTPARDSLAGAFEDWVAGRERCAVPTASGAEALPMVLVAASGGGIRAATWTAGVLSTVDGRRGGCAASPVFLSSGVSGGSVGLAVARGGDPRGVMAELAGPDALAAAVAGTLVGDLVAGNSGVRLPSVVADEWAWRDRAALMEVIWERDSPTLVDRHSPQVRGPGGVLVLNSTAAGLGCRVLVSQVDLEAADGRRDPVTPDGQARDEDDLATTGCSTATGQPAASLDLRSTYDGCALEMSWATAAMLSARFPTVTPAGRVPGADCPNGEDMQLVDGGYAEGSGLGTLADVAAQVMTVVRDHNAEQGAQGPFVVPVVLYLEDEPRTEIVREPEDLAPELIVPLVGRGAAEVQVATSTWLQRLARAVVEPCPPSPSTACADVAESTQAALTDVVVVAAPFTRPAVEAPLGWTLSADSQARMADDLDRQTSTCAGEGYPRPGRYPCLAHLLALLEGDQPPPPR